MPTVYRFGRGKIKIFHDHNPPHFHIWTPEGDMQVSLLDLSPMNGRIDKGEYELAMTWVRGNIELLWQEWNRLNE